MFINLFEHERNPEDYVYYIFRKAQNEYNIQELFKKFKESDYAEYIRTDRYDMTVLMPQFWYNKLVDGIPKGSITDVPGGYGTFISGVYVYTKLSRLNHKTIDELESLIPIEYFYDKFNLFRVNDRFGIYNKTEKDYKDKLSLSF